jgi:hypothetical protein
VTRVPGPRLARTPTEAGLYMDLHRCPCGGPPGVRSHAVVQDGAELLSRYTEPCPRCGTPRQFTFRLPELEDLPTGPVGYGRGRPSELIDAGEWYWFSDRCASAVAAEPEDEAAVAATRRALGLAVEALEQVLLFLPADASEPPDTAFWSEQGCSVRAAEPGRFDRERIEAVRATYQRLLTALDAPAS